MNGGGGRGVGGGSGAICVTSRSAGYIYIPLLSKLTAMQNGVEPVYDAQTSADGT